MATSLEARVPLLDPRLVEAMALAPRAWKVRGTRTKVLLRDVTARTLPPSIVGRAKHGFGPPVAAWLRGRMRADVDALTDPAAGINRLLEPAAVRSVVDDFRRGAWRDGQVWALVVLDRWARGGNA
jgi:asparagine synthase (glutamine-hydrolysing)